MATLRAVSGTESLSLSRGWKDYFLCCFMRKSPSGAGLRGTNRAPSGLPSSGGGGIVDYGSRKSDYVQVTSRSTPDDDRSDCDESQGNIRPVQEQNGQDGERQNCTRSTSTESRETPKLTTIPGSTPNHATYNKDSRNLTLDGRAICDRNGEGRIEEEGDLEEEHPRPVAEESVVAAAAMVAMATVTVSAVGSAATAGAASAASPGPGSSSVAELKHGSSGHDTVDSHLFDISDLHLDKSSSSMAVSPCGSIRLTLAYNNARELMTVTVHEAHDIPSQERGGANQTQVRMSLLPSKKIRQKTKVKSGENPQFEEVLDFRVPRDDVSNMGLRIRLYGCERFRREFLIGETIFAFTSINTVDSSHQTTWVNLEPRNSLSTCDSLSDLSSLAPSESSSSNLSLQHGGTPELMIGLAYNATTGRLSVEVIKGSNFRNVATKRRPDTYVKMTLTAPNGEEITSSKTSVRRGQANPLFKEMFVFQVAQFHLPDVSLLISIFAQRSLKRKDTVGWFSLGSTSSSEEEQGHWSAMLNSNGEQVCRWHALLEP